jgi:uncharacterized protein with FMN-binding domain
LTPPSSTEAPDPAPTAAIAPPTTDAGDTTASTEPAQAAPTTDAAPTTQAAATTHAAPTTHAAATTAPASSRSVDGPAIGTPYGDVQVRVVLRGTQIVDVEPLTLPSDRSRSRRISQEAAPLLRSEALHAQSANIDLLSGASYTSEGYAESLQGALDSAR